MDTVKLILTDSKTAFELDFNIAVRSNVIARLISELGYEQPIPVQLTRKEIEYFRFYVCHSFYPPLNQKVLLKRLLSDKKTNSNPTIEESVTMLKVHLFLDLNFISNDALIDQAVLNNAYFWKLGISYADLTAYFERNKIGNYDYERIYKTLVQWSKTEDLYKEIVQQAARCATYGCDHKADRWGVCIECGQGFCGVCMSKTRNRVCRICKPIIYSRGMELLIVAAKDIRSWQNFKTNYYDDLIIQLKKQKIKFHLIESETGSDFINTMADLSQYHSKLVEYFKFYPSFILVDKSSLNSKGPLIKIYGADVTYNDSIPQIKTRTLSIPNTIQLMNWIIDTRIKVFS